MLQRLKWLWTLLRIVFKDLCHQVHSILFSSFPAGKDLFQIVGFDYREFEFGIVRVH